jgi:hypothetical protein
MEVQKMTRRVLVVDEETWKLYMIDGVKEFKEHNPNLQGIKITQNLIARRAINYYLGRGNE